MTNSSVEEPVRQIDPQLRDLLRRAMQGELERPSLTGFVPGSTGLAASPELGLFLLPLLPFWAWWNFHSYEGLGVTSIEKTGHQFRLTEKWGRVSTVDRKRLNVRTVELGDGRRMLVLIARRPGTRLQHFRVPLTLLEVGQAPAAASIRGWTDFLGVRAVGGTIPAKTSPF